MLSAKKVADFITILRAFLGFSLVWLGVTEGTDNLQKGVLIMIAAWTGDIIDGKIARRSRQYYHTWIGDHDLEVDMTVSCGLLVYLITAGYINVWVASLYILIWSIVLWRWRNINFLGMLCQAPIYGWFVWVALTRLPNIGVWILIWIVVAIVVTWPQFPNQVILGFLSSIREFMINKKDVRGD